MAKDKKAKKREKRLRKYREQYAENCPNCKHPAHEHAHKMTSIMLWGASHACAASIEKRGEDGLWRQSRCKCDLTPDDVLLNVSKNANALSASAFLSNFKVAEG